MRKIFLAENNEAIREILEIFLTSENYDVKSFANVSEFEERDTHIIPDLYLFDVMLHDRSGIDLCHQIKKDQENSDIPVIIMSAHASFSHMRYLCQPRRSYCETIKYRQCIGENTKNYKIMCFFKLLFYPPYVCFSSVLSNWQNNHPNDKTNEFLFYNSFT